MSTIMDQQIQLDIYTEKMNNMLKQSDHKYLFEITKCCGWGFILPIFKMNTLEEFHHTLHLELSHLTSTSIYMQNINGERLEIPRNNTTVVDFVNANNSWFLPIYPLPSHVVYKVFFDDGHCHTHCN